MSRNYYSEINLHITWHCKGSLPLLSPQAEALAHRAIRQKLLDTPGTVLHEIGGTETHVHLAVSIPPTVTISDLVGRLKGASAHYVNVELGRRDKQLQWQAGYGVVSFGSRDVEWVRRYIRNQRAHHASGKAHARLERITATEADGLPEEPPEGG